MKLRQNNLLGTYISAGNAIKVFRASKGHYCSNETYCKQKLNRGDNLVGKKKHREREKRERN